MLMIETNICKQHQQEHTPGVVQHNDKQDLKSFRNSQ